MIYEFRDGKAHARAVEYSVAYHCNLRCSGCSHMSPFLAKRLPSVESFESDVTALGKALHARDIRLVGGEPLLHPKIGTFARIAKESGIADTVMVTTNGLLLHRMDDDFWRNVDFVSVTLYPDAQPKSQLIRLFEERARESNTRLRLFPNPVFRTTIVTRPHPPDRMTDLIFRTCKNAHLYHCHMIHEGKLYKCSVPPFLGEYLGRLNMEGYDPSPDSFDIHGSADIRRDLEEFLTSTRTLDACRYCLGYVGRFQKNHQLDAADLADPFRQEISRETHLDRYKFLKETLRYWGRRMTEKLTGKATW